MAALDLPIVPAGVASAEDKWRESYGGEGYLERTSSEEQCELMMDALRRELGEIKNQLAWLTYHLDESSNSAPEGGEHEAEHIRSPSSRLSGARSGADTPHTAKKKMEKAKEAIEKATKAALAEKERKKHFLEVVDRAEDAQKRFSEEYLRLLQVHVELQRQQVQENSRRLLRKMRLRERKEKALRRQSKPARFRSLPSNDDSSFLKKLYHSTYYQIIGTELQMKKTGKLQKLSDLKEFWELMLEIPSPHPPLPPRLSQTNTTPTLLQKPHPLVEDEGHTSWALTDLPPEQNIREPHSSRFWEREAHKSQHLSQPLHLPQVRPISSLLSHSLTHQNSQKEKARAHQRKIEIVERSRQHTRHMYQQARANEMAMRTLLPDIGSLGLNAEEDDEKETTCDRPQLPSSDKTTSVEAKLETRRRTSKFQQKQTLSAQKETDSVEPLGKQSLSGSAAASETKKDVATPLTMNSLLDTGIVKEPKGKSAVWSNYKCDSQLTGVAAHLFTQNV